MSVSSPIAGVSGTTSPAEGQRVTGPLHEVTTTDVSNQYVTLISPGAALSEATTQIWFAGIMMVLAAGGDGRFDTVTSRFSWAGTNLVSRVDPGHIFQIEYKPA